MQSAPLPVYAQQFLQPSAPVESLALPGGAATTISSMLALRDAVKRRKSIDIVPEESPKYESQSNGVIENSIRTVQAQIRTMKDALESRIGVRI